MRTLGYTKVFTFMIFVFGTSHTVSPLDQVAQLAFTQRTAHEARRFFMKSGVISGVVILSTCNRVELYVCAPNLYAAFDIIRSYLCRSCKNSGHTLIPYVYLKKQRDAIRHLCRVAAGLDSMIPGETQILGQVKNAFFASEQDNAVDQTLHRIFTTAFTAAKRVHAATSLSTGKISVGSVAIDLIKQKVATLHNKKMLIIGVGKVTELVIKYVHRENPHVIFIANRSYDKASMLAQRINGKAYRFDDLEEAVRDADIIISATASPHLILRAELFERLYAQFPELTEQHKYIVDLALPRDVDPAIGELNGITVFDQYDLKALIDSTLARRQAHVPHAEKIITTQVKKLWTNHTSSAAVQARSL